MREIPLCLFIDFALKVGTPKLDEVRWLKEGKADQYPPFDKALREVLVDRLRKPLPDEALDVFMANESDRRKRKFFPPTIAGYRKFIESIGSTWSWFEPPRVVHQLGDVSILVQPDIGLNIHGTRHVIWLHIPNGNPLTSRRVSMHLILAAAALRHIDDKGIVAILDAKNARLHTLKAIPNPRTNVFLHGEAASFATIHASL